MIGQATNPYIKKYLDTLTKAKESAEKKIETTGKDGLESFRANCQIWLGGFWDDIEKLDCFFQQDSLTQHVDFLFHFQWGEYVHGIIRSQGWGYQRQTTRPTVFLDMTVGAGIRGFSAKTESTRLTSEITSDDGRYAETATPIEELTLGEVLYKLSQASEELKEFLAKVEKRRRDSELDNMERTFGHLPSAEEVNIHAMACREKASDEWVRWDAAAEKAYKRIAAAEEERRQEEERQAKAEEELKRLQEIAAAAFLRISVYRIICAILPTFTDGEQPAKRTEPVKETFFTLADGPDSKGYFTKIYNGEETRIKLNNILSMERIEIDSPEHALVYLIYKFVPLNSSEVPGVSVTFWALPGQEIPEI